MAQIRRATEDEQARIQAAVDEEWTKQDEDPSRDEPNQLTTEDGTVWTRMEVRDDPAGELFGWVFTGEGTMVLAAVEDDVWSCRIEQTEE